LRVLSGEKPLKAWASRRGKINSLNPVSDSWAGSGLVAGFLTGASLVQLSHLKMAEIASKSRYLQTRQEIRKIGKTRNQLLGKNLDDHVNLSHAFPRPDDPGRGFPIGLEKSSNMCDDGAETIAKP
jgi:hypothetical protein